MLKSSWAAERACGANPGAPTSRLRVHADDPRSALCARSADASDCGEPPRVGCCRTRPESSRGSCASRATRSVDDAGGDGAAWCDACVEPSSRERERRSVSPRAAFTCSMRRLPLRPVGGCSAAGRRGTVERAVRGSGPNTSGGRAGRQKARTPPRIPAPAAEQDDGARCCSSRGTHCWISWPVTATRRTRPMRLELTKRGDYALRAVLALARVAHDERRSVREMAIEQGIPVRFLPQIMTALARAGLVVVATSGRSGGYRRRNRRRPSHCSRWSRLSKATVAGEAVSCAAGLAPSTESATCMRPSPPPRRRSCAASARHRSPTPTSSLTSRFRPSADRSITHPEAVDKAPPIGAASRDPATA